MRKILFAFVALTACANNDSTNPGDDDTGSGSGSGSGSGGEVSAADKQQDYDDVATSLGSYLSGSEVGAMVDSVNMAYGRNPTGFTLTQATDYVLLTGTKGNLNITYKLYCRDDADLPTACNGAENHAHVRPTYSGAVAIMDDVQRSAAWIVRDVALATPQLGGSGTDTFSSHLPKGDYTLVVTDTIKHVYFAVTPQMPLNGSIDLTVNVSRTRTGANPAARTFDVTVHITFTDGGSATITLDSSLNYSLDLSTGSVTKA